MDATLPNMVNGFGLYIDAEKMVGTTGEVKLPELSEQTVEVFLHGMAGKVNKPGVGNFEAMEITIPFQCESDEYFDVLARGQGILLTLRAEVRARGRQAAKPVPMGWRLHITGDISKSDLGTLKKPGETNCSITVQIERIASFFNDRERLILDLFNQIYRVNGRDMLLMTRLLT